MNQSELEQKGNMLRVKLEGTCTFSSTDKEFVATSPKYSLSGLAMFQVKVNAYLYKITSYDSFRGNIITNTYKIVVFISFAKVLLSDDLVYNIKLNSEALAIQDKVFACDDTSWRFLHELMIASQGTAPPEFSFDVTVLLGIQNTSSALTVLHEDTDLTDFELHCEDGSVPVHKAVLAGHSPFFKRMLSEKWRETSEGRIEIPDIKKQTLLHLKDYMYLQQLPETGLEHLAFLASYYMMSDLESKCSVKLLNNMTTSNAFDLAEFSVKHKLNKLFLGILKNIQDGLVKVEDLDICLLNNKKTG